MYSLTTSQGVASWNGYQPKFVYYCGYSFGWHKAFGECETCGKYSNYSLHAKYKIQKSISQEENKSRIYICSEHCFKSLIIKEMYNFAVPFNEGKKIIKEGRKRK